MDRNTKPFIEEKENGRVLIFGFPELWFTPWKTQNTGPLILRQPRIIPRYPPNFGLFPDTPRTLDYAEKTRSMGRLFPRKSHILVFRFPPCALVFIAKKRKIRNPFVTKRHILIFWVFSIFGFFCRKTQNTGPRCPRKPHILFSF